MIARLFPGSARTAGPCGMPWRDPVPNAGSGRSHSASDSGSRGRRSLGPTGVCPRPARRPLSVEVSPSANGFDDRHQERRDQTRHSDERRWAAYARLRHERGPASLSFGLHGEPAAQRDGNRGRQGRAPTCEGARDGHRGRATTERERRREQPDVVEDLQAAVRLAPATPWLRSSRRSPSRARRRGPAAGPCRAARSGRPTWVPARPRRRPRASSARPPGPAAARRRAPGAG